MIRMSGGPDSGEYLMKAQLIFDHGGHVFSQYSAHGRARIAAPAHDWHPNGRSSQPLWWDRHRSKSTIFIALSAVAASAVAALFTELEPTIAGQMDRNSLMTNVIP
jgi:hypothetical protein